MSGHIRYIPHVLALAISAVASSSYALEAISDQEMSDTTGEGLAFLPEGFKIVMEDADTSYINLIPRGETKDPDGAGGPLVAPNRADLYMRNLSITRDDETLTRASNALIRSWGSGANPFYLSVRSETRPTYATASGSQPRSFLRLEAPQYCFTGVANGAGTNCIAGVDTGDALDAYNLRLGFTLDILSKTNTDTEGYIVSGTPRTGVNLTGANGLGLQAIWNGLSINGTTVDVFQTPSDSATTEYNSTLGLRAVLRLNTDYDAGVAAKANNGLRFTTALDNDYNGTTNRLFDANEGLYVYGLDVNLPLGIPHYQSVIFGRSGSTGNFYMELTRLPNNPNAYGDAYIDYTGTAASIAAKTCDSVNCGSLAQPATHGTISIDKVEFRDKANNIVNLGSAKIEGLFIQHLKLTTTGL